MNPDMGLSVLQTKIISGAFDLSETKVEMVITSFDKSFILSIDTLIDRETIDIIRDKGFSRIPIYYG
jgi:CBS domain containing-hemolysin-like protein